MSNHRMHIQRSLLFLLLLPLFLFMSTPYLYAKDVITTNIDFGKRSVIEDYDEAPQDEYIFQSYSARYTHDVSSSTRYGVNTLFSNRLYDDTGARNHTASLKASLNSRIFDLSVFHKEKRYSDEPNNEYNQTSVKGSLEKVEKKNYIINLKTSIDSFNYLTAHNKNVVYLGGSGNCKKYFYDTALMLAAHYDFEVANREQQNKKRIKQNMSLSTDYSPESPLISNCEAEIGYGARDTKQIEYSEQEFDYDDDYSYTSYHLQTTHKLGDKTRTNLQYDSRSKEYEVLNFNYTSSSFQNKWACDIVKDDLRRIWFNVSGEYKRIMYDSVTSRDYDQIGIVSKIQYKKRDSYKIYAAFNEGIYIYRREDADKMRYAFSCGIDKDVFNKKLGVTFDVMYRYTDYEAKNDNTYIGAQLGCEYKF